MANWSSPKRLAELADFYAEVQGAPESVSDADFIQRITETFWPTSCWCFVEEAFAIIAPGCAMRPHLARALIVHPIEAMIAGGLEDENEVIGQGVACATKINPYVEPTAEGKRWLGEQWPLLELLAIEVFRAKFGELSQAGGFQLLEDGSEEPVIVVQAEPSPHGIMLGVRPLCGGNAICMEEEVRLLPLGFDR